MSEQSSESATALDPPALADAALGYARRGWRVFPVEPGAKLPIGGHGFKDATSDVERVAEWWRAWPEANIGLALAPSGLVAIDVDAYKPECGWAAFAERAEVPDTLRQRSARGGEHFIFAADPAERFAGKIEGVEHVDVKSAGYVLLAPSVFEGGRYRWLNDLPPAPAPAWVPRRGDKASAPEPTERAEASEPAALGMLARLARDLSLPIAAAAPAESHRVAAWARAAFDAELARVRGAREGERNHALNAAAFALGSIVAGGGLDREHVAAALLSAALSAGLGETEARKTIASGLDAGARDPRHPPERERPASFGESVSFGLPVSEKSARERLNVRRFDDDAAPVLDDAWLVDDVLPMQGLGAIYGAPSSGKTFVLLALALAVGGASDAWHGKRVEPGAVLYLSMEGGALFANRLAAFKRHTGRSAPFFYRSPENVDLRGPADAPVIVDAAREIAAECGQPLRLVVVDTLSRAMPGGNENSAEDMTRLVNNCEAIRKALGCYIAVVHHTGKDESRGLRGHSSLFGAVDTEIKIGGGAIEIEKQRDGERGERFGFRLEVVTLGESARGRLITSCVAVPGEIVDADKPAEPRGEVTKRTLRALENFLAEPSCASPTPAGVGFPEPGSHVCCDEDAFVEFAAGRGVSHAKTQKAQREAVLDALARLVDGGFAVKNAGKVWIPNARR